MLFRRGSALPSSMVGTCPWSHKCFEIKWSVRAQKRRRFVSAEVGLGTCAYRMLLERSERLRWREACLLAVRKPLAVMMLAGRLRPGNNLASVAVSLGLCGWSGLLRLVLARARFRRDDHPVSKIMSVVLPAFLWTIYGKHWRYGTPSQSSRSSLESTHASSCLVGPVPDLLDNVSDAAERRVHVDLAGFQFQFARDYQHGFLVLRWRSSVGFAGFYFAGIGASIIVARDVCTVRSLFSVSFDSSSCTSRCPVCWGE